MSVYVASSWRNTLQPEVVARLTAAGLDVYDFRHPAPGDDGFSWKDVGGPGALAAGLTPKGGDLVPVDTYLQMIAHPRAQEGFDHDMRALTGATTTVLILPCGRSAHLELGYAVGAGQRTAVMLEDPAEPELMYKMVGLLTADLDELVRWTEAQESDADRIARRQTALAEGGWSPELDA